MSRIDDFIEQERNQLKWYDRFLGNYSRITRTANILASSFPAGLKDVTKIRRSIRVMISAAFILLFAIVMILILFRALIYQPDAPIPVILLAILAMGFVGIYGGWNLFFNKKYAFRLAIGHSGISVDDTGFLWQDIADTAILYRWERKRENIYLVIFLKNGLVEKYNLYNFMIRDYKIAGIIEYYKQKQAMSV